MENRDRERYRCKGFQKTCIKTKLGAVKYKRQVYVDNAAAEKQHCVHLLDEALDNKVTYASFEGAQDFHRNKKITECVKNKEFAKILRELLYNKEIDTLLDCMEAQINSTTDKGEIAGLKELQRYYTDFAKIRKSRT